MSTLASNGQLNKTGEGYEPGCTKLKTMKGSVVELKIMTAYAIENDLTTG